jgi:outer membrane protein assembly factor BamA
MDWRILIVLGLVALTSPIRVHASAMPDATVEQTPNVTDSAEPVILKKRQFVIVPIPMSDPALGTGLVLGGAYFYKQTPEQEKAQPPSVTAVAGAYTTTDSYAYGASHQSYWAEDKWRFSGVAGYADLKLDLLSPDTSALGAQVDWLIEGVFVEAKLFRKIAGNWYLGVQGRYFDNEQKFRGSVLGGDLSLAFGLKIKTIGAGLNVEYDTRDVAANPYKGRRFEVDTLYNTTSGDSSDEYQSYYARYRAYHEVKETLVVAWEGRGCYQTGTVPLWDSCKVHLRGFPITEYMSRSSASTQAEARWKPFKRIGFVGFLGAGVSKRNYTDLRDDNLIPSYGVGIRGMVLMSQRINMRLDYARSDGQEAFYLGVTEAF